MPLRKVVRLVLAGLAGSWAVNAAAAPAAPRIVLAVDGVEETRNLPVLLAERLGYFRDEGLTVTLVDAPASPSPADLMADGRADGAVAFYHHTFMSQADDRVVTQDVVTLGVTPALKLMVAQRLHDEVKTLADLKGRKVFTGGPNSGKTTATNAVMLQAGLAIDAYTPLKPTNAKAMAAALASGEADAIMAHEPDASFYASTGAAFMLADLSSPAGVRAALGEVFPSTSLYMPKTFVDGRPAEVQGLVRALLRANAYIQGHDAQTIAQVLPPHALGKDRAAFLRTLASDKRMFETDGRTPEAGARLEWRTMSALNPKYGRIDFAQTFTNRFVGAGAPRP